MVENTRRLVWHHVRDEPMFLDATLSVSRRSQAEKVMQGNLGDRLTSRAVSMLVGLLVRVAATISSTSERSGNVLGEVGWAKSIDDGEDSITSLERSSPNCMRDCAGFMDEVHSPTRSRR